MVSSAESNGRSTRKPPPSRASVSLSYENEDAALVPSLKKRGYRTLPLLHVNGRRLTAAESSLARPGQTLLSFLRDDLGLTGSKLGCAEGGCGACTVMISRYERKRGGSDDSDGRTIVHRSVNACLMPALAADGCHVTTVEGVGGRAGGPGTGTGTLHPIQRAMVDHHGSQCGFCTPGIVVAMYALFASGGGGGVDGSGGGSLTSVEHVEEHMDGNLCRCTGYRPIWDAARSLCSDDGGSAGKEGGGGVGAASCHWGGACGNTSCKNKGGGSGAEEEEKEAPPSSSSSSSSSPWSNRPDDNFPPDLLSTDTEASHPLVVVASDASGGETGTWLQPSSLPELLRLLREFEGACKVVVGNTEVGIETRFKRSVFPRLVYPPPSIESLYDVAIGGRIDSDPRLVIGACVSLSSVQAACGDLLRDEGSPPGLRRIAEPIRDMLRWFASTQIRNAACLGGNLATASPISDMNPLLACMGSELVLASLSPDGGGDVIRRRRVNVSDFFLRYRTVDLRPNEIIESVEVPATSLALEYVVPFKQARRREDDISIVTSGMRVRLGINRDSTGYDVEEISLAFGGMAPTTVLAVETARGMTGRPFDEDTFRQGERALREELMLPPSVPGGQAEYRVALCASFLRKFYVTVAGELLPGDVAGSSSSSAVAALPPAPVVRDGERSAARNFLREPKPSLRGTQRHPASKVGRGLEVAGTDGRVPKDVASKISEGVGGEGKGEDGERSAAAAVVVGKSSAHASAPLHCTGEALYVDDIPLPSGALHGCLVMATKCHARVVSINAAPAMELLGVAGVFAYEDLLKLGGSNVMGPIYKDEVVFLPPGETATFVGQVLGICVADTLEIAGRGARAVEIEYEDLEGETLVSIEQAVAAGSFYDAARHIIERGDARGVLAATSGEDGDCDGDGVDDDGKEKGAGGGRMVTVKGSFRSGGQDHFYLETNTTLAVPAESGRDLTIYASTQAATKTQAFCASATGMPASRVTCRVKRMGGGFGGKETRSVFVSCAAAVAAKLTDRPVRLTLGRDVDMSITGGRHAFLAHYTASAVLSDDGTTATLRALDVMLYNNGGSAFDLSGPVMDRALFHVDGCYHWPLFRAEGVPCRTVQPPNTAFRGFGGPQGMAICEHVMDHLATACGVSGDVLRRDNMYQNGQTAPFGMIVGGEQCNGSWNVPTMWDRLHQELDVPARRFQVEEFNSRNRWVKRGLACIPVKFGIAFTAKFMNQGGALVHLYTDGTILVTHGGTEMGQGLHTKVCQITAQAFGISLEDVYINDTSTDKIANSIPTAASASTDMYGMAALDACRQILKRLEPIIKRLGPDAPLKAVAGAAHMDRINLTAHGFFSLDDDRCGFDWDKPRPLDFPAGAPDNAWKGRPFNYFTQGVACTEVEIDVLTGNHRTLSSDLLVDVGSSINPMIDIGQIEGAFIQGMGWSTIEEVVYADNDHAWIQPTGKVFTSGPGTYKIPAFNDVPEKFNVSLLEDVENPFAVHSSKAIGEPPFFLGCSVFYAIKEAIKAARGEYFDDSYFELRMPATSETIRMMCADEIAVNSVITGPADDKIQRMSAFQPKGSN